MAQKTITLIRGPEEEAQLKEQLKAAGFDFSDAPYAFWRAKSGRCTLTYYLKGKIVLLQIAVPSRVEVPGYQKLRANVHKLVSRINGEPACHKLQ